MNRTYRLIWNACRQAWTAVQETARSQGKRGSFLRASTLATAALLVATPVLANPPAPTALPVGGKVAAGTASISQAGSSMTINQASDRAILNWQSFNIGANASVHFQQPGAHAVALNRVASADPSAIYGRLSANGQVFLSNPAGVIFGAGARVDVGGLVATTMSIQDADFMSGNYRFTRNGARAGVVNQGEIHAQYVALMAPEVRNEGTIAARMGTVALAAGEAVTLGITGHRLVGVQVDKAAIDTLVENRHLVRADEGTVIVSAQSAGELLGRVVNTGTIEANGISADGGTIRLAASGHIDLGGTLRADAGANGKGGSIIAIADLDSAASRTTVSGTLSAKGGSQSGDGGFIETSASKVKVADSARVNTLATNGRAGQWLIDPTDFTVAASGGDISGTTLSTNLSGGNVTIQSSSGANGTNGDVFVNDSVSWSANTLTVTAHRDVNVNATMTVTGSGGLAVEHGQGAVASGNNAKFTVNSPVNMAAGTNLSTKLGSDGTPKTYTIVNDRAGLEAIDATGTSVQGNYALGSNLVFATDWTPLGNTNGPIQGVFEGLGHTISGVTTIASRTEQVGFFGQVASGAEVRNLGITGATVTGRVAVGIVAGDNSGTLHNVHAAGNVSLDAGVGANAVREIGGLVGKNAGTITRGRSSATVTATGGDQSSMGNGGIGGLVGAHQGGSISDSYATGNVSGHTDVGGLIGFAAADASRTYSTGTVTGTTNVGGLAGRNPSGTVADSFWDTAGYATSAAGTGKTDAELKTATTYPASWDTTRTWNIQNGSLPAFLSTAAGGGGGPATITINLDNSQRYYGDTAQPTLTGFSYTGTVDPSDNLSAAAWGSALTDFLAAGDYLYNSTANLLSPTFAFGAGRSIANYTISYNGNKLSVLARPITISADAGQSKVYNGQGGADPALAYTTTLGTGPGLSGAALVNGDMLSGALARAAGDNVGNYAINQGALAASSNYAVTFVPNSFGITPKTVSLSATKTYDGTTALTGTQVTVGTGIGGESLTYSGATANDAHVATAGKFINAITLGDGTGGLASNYQTPTLNNTNAPVTITPAMLTATINNTGVTKEYDGTTAAPAGFTAAWSTTGLVPGDTAATISHTSAAYNDQNVVNANQLTVSGLSLSSINGNKGSVASDYQFTSGTSQMVAATITPKPIEAAIRPDSTVSGVFLELTGSTSTTGGDVRFGSFKNFAEATLADGVKVNVTGGFSPQWNVRPAPETVAFTALEGITRSSDPNYKITRGTVGFSSSQTGLGLFNGVLFWPDVGQGSATVALNNVGAASVGLRVFDSAQFTLGSDLIAGDSGGDESAGGDSGGGSSGGGSSGGGASEDSDSGGGNKKGKGKAKGR